MRALFAPVPVRAGLQTVRALFLPVLLILEAKRSGTRPCAPIPLFAPVLLIPEAEWDLTVSCSCRSLFTPVLLVPEAKRSGT